MESRKFKVGDVLYVLFEPEGLWREGEVMGLQERNGVVKNYTINYCKDGGKKSCFFSQQEYSQTWAFKSMKTFEIKEGRQKRESAVRSSELLKQKVKESVV